METREEWAIEFGTEASGVAIFGGYLDGRRIHIKMPVLIHPLESSEEVYRLQREQGELRYAFSHTRQR